MICISVTSSCSFLGFVLQDFGKFIFLEKATTSAGTILLYERWTEINVNYRERRMRMMKNL